MGRSSTFLTIALVAIGLAFLLNIAPIGSNGMSAVNISHGEIRGAALSHENKLYTLNFNQQETLIDLINRSIPVGAPDVQRGGTPPDFEKVVLYRFGEPEVTLRPILYLSDGSLIYTIPGLHGEGYLQDVTSGEMKKLLSQSYDH